MSTPVFAFNDRGGFIVGDPVTRRTAYALPGSPAAAAAKYGYAEETADGMIRCANVMPRRRKLDAANWKVLDEARK